MSQYPTHSRSAAYKWLKIAPRKTAMFHRKQNRLDRIRRINGPVLFFPCLYQGHQHIETIALWGVWPGVHQSVDFLQRLPIVAIVLDWSNFHAQTSSTLMRSYCA